MTSIEVPLNLVKPDAMAATQLRKDRLRNLWDASHNSESGPGAPDFIFCPASRPLIRCHGNRNQRTKVLTPALELIHSPVSLVDTFVI